MAPNYLNQQDVENYGTDLISFAQRAAQQAATPRLEYLQQQNADLRQQVARVSRARLDDTVATAIPNYLEIDADPQWHQWLLHIDPLSGQIRVSEQLKIDAEGSSPKPGRK